MKKVSIIILNWNKPHLTVACVQSVLKQTYQNFEIILIDNGSEDDSVHLLKGNFSNQENIKLIAHPVNLGYSGGNNLGATHAIGDYVVLLNNDTLVDIHWLTELINALESDPNTAAATSQVIEGDKKNIPLAANQVWETNLISYGVLQNRKTIEPYPETFYPSGCSLIYRRELVAEPFDPDYFIYAEDTYLGWLLRLRGYTIRFARNSIVHHQYNTSKKSNPQVRRHFIYLGERNRLLNLLTFYGPFTLLRLAPVLLFNLILVNFFEPAKAPYRFTSYLWLLAHPHTVWRKRKIIQHQRKVTEKTILRSLSYRLFEEQRIRNVFLCSALRIINVLLFFYCAVFRLKTYEFY